VIRTSTLLSGLQVVTEVMDGVESVALSFWVGTGSRDETDAQAGMSHFLEHLLFKGSINRSALDIAQSIDALGGDMNAFTTKESTAFYVHVLGDDCDLALDILCDVMLEPAFDPDEIWSERQVVREEILMRNDEPADLVHEHYSKALFGDHELGRDILGSETQIDVMKANDIKAFFEHHYRPRNLVFAAAGKLDHDHLVQRLEERFGNRSGGERPKRQAPQINTGVTEVYRRQSDQAHLVFGVPASGRHDPARYALALLDQILGGGLSSRLVQEVREKRGLAYSTYSSYSSYEDAGDLSVYVGTHPKRSGEAVQVIRNELQRIGEDGVDEDELRRAKRSLRATTLMNLEDTTARMSRIGRSLLLHGDVLTVEEVHRRVEAVTVAELKRVTAELMSVEPVLIGLGPIDEKVFA
jgi:predicted Zn-dependent peptidase